MITIAITGGKGGVGKSLLSANLGIAMCQQGNRAVLFDADLQLANADVLLGIQSPYNLQHVVSGQMPLKEVLADGPAGLRVVTGGSAVSTLMSAGPKRMATFFSQLDELKHIASHLIFDTGAGLDTRVMNFLRMSQEVVVVTTPDPTSVTDAYATIKHLLKKEPAANISVLVNFVRNEAESRQVFATLNGISMRFLNRELAMLGYVRADLDAIESVRKRKALMISNPNSDAARDIARVAGVLAAGGVVARSA